MEVTRQIRIYEVDGDQMDEFVEVWRRTAAALREDLGFKVEWAYANRTEGKFVWSIALDVSLDWDEHDAIYMNSPVRRDFDPNPARYVRGLQTIVLNESFDV